MLNVTDEAIHIQFSGEASNGTIPQGALADLFDLRRVQAVAKKRTGVICEELRPYFARTEVSQKGKTVVQFTAPEGTIEEGAFNLKLALNTTRDFGYKERLIAAYTEIELLKSGVRRTKKNVAAACVTAEARLNAENEKIVPTEGKPKVLVTHKEN